MIKVGVIGATGYTGIELLRLIIGHPWAGLEVVTSRSDEDKQVAEVFPGLRGCVDLVFSAPDSEAVFDCDVVFFATPNATAMHMAPRLIDSGIKVIDLSADFRLQDAEEWRKWYGTEHSCPDFLDMAVYGLPEQNREEIKGATLVANPGCYPTAIILALLPVLKSGVVDAGSLIADAKSGVSGAGRKSIIANLYTEVAESFRAYAVAGHRHLPEICRALNNATNEEVSLTFIPHLVPMVRGIHATVYAGIKDAAANLQDIYLDYYREEPFVDVMPAGSHPDTRSVRGTNQCRLAVHTVPDSQRMVVLSVIDNLVKGAAGQALQNMNILFEFDEIEGLAMPAFNP